MSNLEKRLQELGKRVERLSPTKKPCPLVWFHQHPDGHGVGAVIASTANSPS